MIIVNPINPVAINIFGLKIRWYAIAYIAAFIVGFWLMKRLWNKSQVASRQSQENSTKLATYDLRLATGDPRKAWDNLMSAVILGVIIGGRLGYVLFYNLPHFLAYPLDIFAVWQGGMSFHGGLMGVIIAVFLFAWKETRNTWGGASKTLGAYNSPFGTRSDNSPLGGESARVSAPVGGKSTVDKTVIPPTDAGGTASTPPQGGSYTTPFHRIRQTIQNTFTILDIMAVVAPIGLFFGRIANFINMEVMGRVTNVPWGIVFAGSPADTPARHPSPLYEAGLEGILLFTIMMILWRTKLRERPGVLSGIFAILYACFRIIAEQFRQPDEQLGQLGFLMGTQWLTMGMVLSGVMLAAGAGVLAVALKHSATKKSLL